MEDTSTDTRARILAAATEMLKDTRTERLSVRAVAARAGVGASTLRYYFPTQRALFDTVLSSLYAEAIPDERIHDRSIPARVRLIECLRRLLEPVGSPVDGREIWTSAFNAFIGPDATDASRAGYIVLEQQARRRLLSWLAVLKEQGELEPGDDERRADFLMAVVDGLSVARAFPAVTSRLDAEAAALDFAVDAVLPASGSVRIGEARS